MTTPKIYAIMNTEIKKGSKKMDWLWYIASLICMVNEGMIDGDAEVSIDELNATFSHAQVRYVIENFQKNLDEGRL